MFRQIKIPTREIESRSYRVKYGDLPTTKFMNIYLISQVADIHVYYEPSCMEENEYKGR